MIPYNKIAAPLKYFLTDYTRSGMTNCQPYSIPVKSSESTVIPQSRNGFILPGYRNALKHGSNATTPYDATFLSYSRTPGLVSRIGGEVICANKKGKEFEIATGYDGVLDAPSWGVEDSSLVSSALNHALSSLGPAVADALSPFQGGTFIGELSETMRMMRSPLGSLRKSMSGYLHKQQSNAVRYKKRRPGNVKGLQGAISDTYLEAVFGWLPLISDIKDLEKALTRDTKAHTMRVNSTGSSEKSTSSSSGLPVYMITSPIGGKINVVEKHSVTVSCKVGVIIGGTNGSPQTLSEKFGLGLSNFAPTAWELLPWSFVVDYFTNIGDIVNSISIPENKIAWKSFTYKYVVETRRTGSGVPNAPGITITFGSVTSTRTRILRWSPSSLELEIPAIEFNLPNLKQTINLAALYNSLISTQKIVSKAHGIL